MPMAREMKAFIYECIGLIIYMYACNVVVLGTREAQGGSNVIHVIPSVTSEKKYICLQGTYEKRKFPGI